jgi:hypothetical protein
VTITGAREIRGAPPDWLAAAPPVGDEVTPRLYAGSAGCAEHGPNGATVRPCRGLHRCASMCPTGSPERRGPGGAGRERRGRGARCPLPPADQTAAPVPRGRSADRTGCE